MRKWLHYAEIPLQVAVVCALVYLAYVFLARHSSIKRPSERQSEADAAAASAFNAIYGGNDLKILLFYARDGLLTEGKSTLICYGVLNAKAVKIEPAFGDVGPALSRCLEAQPKRDTTYTLTAEGKDGKTATSSFTIRLQTDPEAVPSITSFDVAKHTVERGRDVSIFQSRNEPESEV